MEVVKKVRNEDSKLLARLSSRRQLVIPKSVAAAIGLKAGDLLNVERKDYSIVLRPVDVIERRKPRGYKKSRGKVRKGKEAKNSSSLHYS